MTKKKKEQKVTITQEDEAQARAVLEQYHTIAGKLRSSVDQEQEKAALSTVSSLTEAAQMALLKALSREHHTDAADVLNAIYELSPMKSIHKEARRSLIRLEEVRIYPQWEPSVERLSPIDEIRSAAIMEEASYPARFWKGYVTDSRDVGEVQLMLLWEQGKDYKDVRLLGFLLEFWHDGVKDFFTRIESKRSVERLVEQTSTNTDLVDCSLAKGRRLIEEALAVNKKYGTPIHKDFRLSLSLVNKLVLENPDIPDEEEEEEEFEEEIDDDEISAQLAPFAVVTGFIEAWASEEYDKAYNYLASDSRLREGLSQDEWVEQREEWADEAEPEDLKPVFIHELEVKKSGIWLPNPFSRGATNTEKEVEAGWSIELADTIEEGQLPELPQETIFYKETGRHWFWTSYKLVDEPGGWRILDMVDEGKNAQTIAVAELRNRIKNQNKQIEEITRKHSPTDPDALQYIEKVLLHTALALYYDDALIKQDPHDDTTYYDAIGRTVLLRDVERRIAYLEELARQFPEKRGEALLQIGELQVDLSEKYDELEDEEERTEHFQELAEATLRESLTIEDSTVGRIALADLFLNIGDDEKLDEAEDELHHAQTLTSDNEELAIIECRLGSVATEREEYEAALSHYQRVEELDPAHGDTKYNLGSTQHKLGRTEEAIANLKQAIESDPQAIDAYAELFSVYLDANQVSMAREVLEEGIEAIPSTIELRLLLASTYIKENDLRGAEELVSEAEKIDPFDESVRMYRQVLTISKHLPPARKKKSKKR
ncbi:MAG TPA: hypothetical protein DCK85_06320 [Ktedonobacter sp.]|nr:hypothetical protein [Ktedonobacter sp.]